MSTTHSIESLAILLQRSREVMVAPLREKLATFDLTEQQWRVIRVTFINGGLNANDLATKSAILGPSLSRILQKLQSEGILSRKQAESDLRELIIKLTPAGKRLHNKVNPMVEDCLNAMETNLGEKRVKQLSDILAQVVALQN